MEYQEILPRIETGSSDFIRALLLDLEYIITLEYLLPFKLLFFVLLIGDILNGV